MIRTPQWLKNRAGEIEEAPMPLPPPIAMMPPPSMVTQKPAPMDPAQVITLAHEYVQTWEREKAADKKMIVDLQVLVTEATLAIEGAKKKITELEKEGAKKIRALELEIMQTANDKQTLQTQVTEYRQLLSLQRQLQDRWEIKAPERKPRKPRKEKHPPKALPDGSMPGDKKNEQG